MKWRAKYRAAEARYAAPWAGAYRRYDIVKEFVVALVVVSLLTLGLAAVFGSPDRTAITLAEWATNAPNDFVATATSELAGSSGTATYGAPYVDDPTAGQKIGPLALQRWAGVTTPVDTATEFVLNPLATVPGDQGLTDALAQYKAATADQQQKWATAYGDALTAAPDNDPAKVTAGDYGPVPVLADRLLGYARSGGLDGQLLAAGSFYQTDYTRSVLFLADGTYLADQAAAAHLGGEQWGMMNETGRYPGQAWLWLYTFWYQVPPFTTKGSSWADSADAWIWGIMLVLSLVLILVPFIPGLRSLPRYLGVHKVIWRNHYRAAQPR